MEGLLIEELARQGVTGRRLKITVCGQSKPLWTDTWDEEHRELYEAKGTVLLSSDPGEDRPSTLLPNHQLVALVRAQGCGVVMKRCQFIRAGKRALKTPTSIATRRKTIPTAAPITGPKTRSVNSRQTRLRYGRNIFTCYQGRVPNTFVM